MADLYELLGVARDANDGDIKKAYRRLAMEYHPDRNPGDKAAEDKFKEAANAYQVLSNAELRARYDRFGEAGLNGAASQSYGFNGVEDIFSTFGDLFGDFFGQRQRRTARGADLRMDLRLSFAEAVWGTTKEVEVPRRVACQTCDGSGAKPGTSPESCTQCGGKGQVVHSQGFFMIQTACPACRGEGTRIREHCPSCRGQGVQEERTKLTVNVPAGVDDGQTLRLANKGEVSREGGQPGHLYVVLHVEADERFHREEEHVLTSLPISYVQAALGAEVEVPTLDDACEGRATIEIKPGSQPGDVVVRRGEGITRVNGRGRGDHHIQLKIVIPTKLSAREDELLRELAAETGEDVRGPKKGLFERIKQKLD